MGKPSRAPGLLWKTAKPPESRYSTISRFRVSRFKSTSLPQNQLQNIRGRSQIAGGWSHDRLGSDRDFAIFANGIAHIGLAYEIHRLRRGSGRRLRRPLREESTVSTRRPALREEALHHIGGDIRNHRRNRWDRLQPVRAFRGMRTTARRAAGSG